MLLTARVKLASVMVHDEGRVEKDVDVVGDD